MQPEKYAAFPAAYFSLSRLLISSGHLTLFSLSVPRLSFFTVLFFCSRGTTLTILFSCPAFWYFSQLFYTFSQFSRFFGAPGSFSLSVPRLFFLTTLFFYSWGTTLTILFSCPAFWYFSQLFYAFSQFSRFFGAPDSFFSFCAPFILFHCSLFLFLGHHTHNFLLMPRFLTFFSAFLSFLTIFSVFRGTWLFFPFLCPVYPFSLSSFSVHGAPHSQFSSHAPPHAKPQHSND